MKKLAKIFALLLVLALCVTGIVLAVSADEPAAQVNEPAYPQSVSISPEFETQLRSEGILYLQFGGESAFLAAKDDLAALKAAGVTLDGHKATYGSLVEFDEATETLICGSNAFLRTGGKYYYLLVNVALANDQSQGSSTYNLGGHTISSLANETVAPGAKSWVGRIRLKATNGFLHIVNGVVSNTKGTDGLFMLDTKSSGSVFTFTDVTFANSGKAAAVVQNIGTDGAVIGFKDCVVDTGVAAFVQLKSVAGHKPTTVFFNNTTYTSTAGKFIDWLSATAGTVGYVNVYVNGGCKISAANFVALANSIGQGSALNVEIASGAKFGVAPNLNAASGSYRETVTYSYPDGQKLATNEDSDSATYPFVVRAPLYTAPTPVGDIKDYKWIAYANENDFLADLDGDNRLDGLNANGNSVVEKGGWHNNAYRLYDFTDPDAFFITKYTGGTGTTAEGVEITLSINSYYYLFADVTYTTTDGSGRGTQSSSNITIDLGGHKLTLKSPIYMGCFNAITARMTIKNGTLCNAEANGAGAIAPKYGATVNLYDLTIVDSDDAANGGYFIQDGGANINMTNVTVSITRALSFIATKHTDTCSVMNICPDVDCTCHTACTSKHHGRGTVDTAQDYVTGVFKNVDFTSAKGAFLKIEVVKHTSSAAATVTAIPQFIDYSFDADCSLNAPGGFVASGAAYFDGDIKVALADGVLMNTIAWATESNNLDNGLKVTATGFVGTADAVYAFVVGTPDAKVYWYDENGMLIGTTDHLAGDIPSFEYNCDGIVDKANKIYMLSAIGWATTQGGDIIDIPAVTEKQGEISYYCITDEVLAAVVLYNAAGGIIDCWTEDNLTTEKINSVPANGTIKLQMDVEVNRGSVKDQRMKKYNDGITLDLGGYTLFNNYYEHEIDGNGKIDVEGESKSVNRWFSVAGKTLTIINGTMKAGNNENIFMGEGAGTIKLINVNLVGSNWSIADWRGGTLEMYGGSITGGQFIAATQYNNVDVTVKIMGVDVNCGSGYIIGTKPLPDRKATFVFGAYEGKATNISAAQALVRVVAGEDLTANTAISIDITDTYASGISANNPISYDGNYTFVEGVDAVATERANFNIYVNNFYSNKGLGTKYGNATYNRGAEMVLANAGSYRVAYMQNPTVDKMDASLTLYADFNFNLFIPVNSNVSKLMYGEAVLFDAAAAEAYEVVDGCYKVTIKVAPNEVAKKLAITIEYAMDDATLGADAAATVVAKYSITKYLADLATSEDATITAENKAAARVIAAYAAAAYDYFSATAAYDEALLAQLVALVDADTLAYINSFDFSAMDDEDDFDGVNVTAAFNADSAPLLTLTFGEGVAWTVNGRSGVGGTCIINLRAYTLCDTITITAGGETATFSLGEYVANRIAAGATETELTALKAFYAYGATAKALKGAN